MTTDPDVTTPLSPMVEALAVRTDIIRVIAEAATSYRKHLETLGWEPEVVTAMSAQVLCAWTMEALR